MPPNDEKTVRTPLAADQVFGGYRLTRRLGGGGFGEVWAADSPEDQPVALKFVGRNDVDNRFGPAEKELQGLWAARDINHPNVLRLRPGPDDDRYLIIAMELADGTLLERQRACAARGEAGIPRDELLVYLRQAAAGIDHLNSRNVLHYDIKPENLLLFGAVVKVADFGLARLIQHSLTVCDGGMTLAYAAPEFFAGKAVKFASDQYSLAAAYCRLRCGKPLFDAGDLAGWLYNHTQTVPDLSDLPEEERPAVARALFKEPMKRWANCTQFVEILTADIEKADARRAKVERDRTTQASRHEETKRLSETYGSKAHRPRHGAWGTLVAGCLLLLFALGGWGVWYSNMQSTQIRKLGDEIGSLHSDLSLLGEKLEHDRAGREQDFARLGEKLDRERAVRQLITRPQIQSSVEDELAAGRFAEANLLLDLYPPIARDTAWQLLHAHASSNTLIPRLWNDDTVQNVAINADGSKLIYRAKQSVFFYDIITRSYYRWSYQPSGHGPFLSSSGRVGFFSLMTMASLIYQSTTINVLIHLIIILKKKINIILQINQSFYLIIS